MASPAAGQPPSATGSPAKRPLEDPSPEAVPPASKHLRRNPTGEEMGRAGPGLQRYLVAVEYIGTGFFGSQRQPNCRTVVGALEDAFEKFIGQPVSVFCSSRTDAGVHALSNVCHVDVERISKRKPGEVLPPHEPGVVKRAVNHFLQKKDGDIMVNDVKCVPPEFHARFMALERTYYYRLLSGPEPMSVFEKDRAWHVPENLNIQAMKDACRILVGHHDFSSFRAAGCQANSPIRTLDELTILEVYPSLPFPSTRDRHNSAESTTDISENFEHMVHGNISTDMNNLNGRLFGQRTGHRCYVVTARARSFLYHQVRLMVGVLKAVGTGEITFADVERILKAKNVTAARPMAPSSGLYLANVKYDIA